MNPNPYRSPASSPPAPVQPPTGRPASLIVFGILDLVFGVLGICGTAASSAMVFVKLPRDPSMPNPVLDLIESDATYRLVLQATLLLGTVASLVLIVAGIGLLLSRSWGRTLSIAYGWYAIVGAIFGVFINWFFLVQPLLAKAKEAGGAAEAGAIGGAIGGLAGGCLGLIFPIVLLVFMYRPAVRDALAGRASGSEPPQ